MSAEGDGRVTLPARMNGHEWESMPTWCNGGDTDPKEVVGSTVEGGRGFEISI